MSLDEQRIEELKGIALEFAAQCGHTVSCPEVESAIKRAVAKTVRERTDGEVESPCDLGGMALPTEDAFKRRVRHELRAVTLN